MILFFGDGRLGNQIFQYSFMRSIEDRDHKIVTWNFEDIVNLAQYRYIEDKIFMLDNFDTEDEDDKIQIIKQINSLSPTLKEMFLEMAIVGNKLKADKAEGLRKIIIDHYRNYIIKLKGKTVSTLLQEDEDRLRCLPDESTDYTDWNECEGSVEEEIEDVKIEEKVNLELNPYGYYGIMANKKGHRFKVMKVQPPKKKKSEDLRGPVCMEIVPKQRVIDIIEDLNKDEINIETPIDIVMKDREKFISDIVKRSDKYNEEELEEMDDERIKNIYYWYVKAGKKDMCNGLQNWFTEKELMLYEK